MAKEAAKKVAKSTRQVKKQKKKKSTPRIHVKHLSPKQLKRMMKEYDLYDQRIKVNEEVEKTPRKTLKQYVSENQRKFKQTDREVQNLAPGGVHALKSYSVADIVGEVGVTGFAGRGILEVSKRMFGDMNIHRRTKRIKKQREDTASP